MQLCPKCSFAKPAGAESCPKCGVIYAKVARIRSEAVQERNLSDLLEKEMGKGTHEDDESFELIVQENRYRDGGYPVSQLISGFLYFMAALILIATFISTYSLWTTMGQVNQLSAGDGLGLTGGIFSAKDRMFWVVMQLLGGLTAAAMVAAVAAGLHLGRDIALNTQLAKEYLHRLHVRRGSKNS